MDFVVEAAEPGTVIASHKKWEKILIENDYICAFSTPIERYYVDMRKEHLIDRFAKVKDFMNQNEVVVFRMENVDVNTVL